MRKYLLEDSYDLGIALCGTFPEIKGIQFVLLSCILRRTSFCSHGGVGLGGVENLEQRKNIQEG